MNNSRIFISWKHAAVAASLLVISPVRAESLLIDNSEPNAFSKTGTWTMVSNGTEHQGSTYLYVTAGSSSTAAARWRPTITTSGYYRIYMKWGAAPNRSEKAALEITYDGGNKVDATRDVSQEHNEGAWVYVGNYFLASGTANSVRLRASTSGSGNVVADAMLFDLSGTASSDGAGTEPTQTREVFSGSQAVKPEQVEIVRTDSGTGTPYFQLRISGTNFCIKGSCGPEMPPAMVKEAGGNAIRNYNVNNIQSLTEMTEDEFFLNADANGIKVLFGLVLVQAERETADFYDDLESPAVQNQFNNAMAIVNMYKKYKSILGWTIGNELDPLTLPPEKRENVYKFIQRLARAIREADHYHPVMTCHASTAPEKVESIMALAPDVDIVGCNAYGPHLSSVYPNYITNAGWRGPYVHSVWGVEHSNGRRGNGEEAVWTDPPGTEPVWRAPLEEMSADKHCSLLNLYHDAILLQEGRCVGAFAFKGAKGGFRITHTWFPFLDEKMKPTPCYDAVRFLWSGTPVAVNAPRVQTLTIEAQEGKDNVTVSGTTGTFMAFGTVTAADGAALTYKAEIRRDVDKTVKTAPPVLNSITITPHSGDPRKFFVSKPDMAALGDGFYRLYYYVYRGGDAENHHSSGSGNIPFRYKKQ